MIHPGGYQREVTFNETPEFNSGNLHEEHYGTMFQSFMVKGPHIPINQVYGAGIASFEHHLVLDTACQKTCCSSVWLRNYADYINKHHLQPWCIDSREPFEFGHGPTQFSNKHAFLFTCFDGLLEHSCIIGASVIPTTNDIPLLGSNNLLREALGAIIDLPKNKARLTKVGCTVPILVVNEHLALDISKFPEDVNFSDAWMTFCHMELHESHEFVLPLPNAEENHQDDQDAADVFLKQESSQDNLNSNETVVHGTSTTMDASLASVCPGNPPRGVVLGKDDDSSRSHRHQILLVDSRTRSNELGGERGPVAEGVCPMRTQEDSKVRQPPRVVQQMP